MPGYRVYRADRFQFRGGVLLLVKNNVRHDHFILRNVVNVETEGVCLYLQNNIRRLFVYNPPDTLILHSDLDSVFFLVQFCCFSRCRES